MPPRGMPPIPFAGRTTAPLHHVRRAGGGPAPPRPDRGRARRHGQYADGQPRAAGGSLRAGLPCSPPWGQTGLGLASAAGGPADQVPASRPARGACGRSRGGRDSLRHRPAFARRLRDRPSGPRPPAAESGARRGRGHGGAPGVCRPPERALYRKPRIWREARLHRAAATGVWCARCSGQWRSASRPGAMAPRPRTAPPARHGGTDHDAARAHAPPVERGRPAGTRCCGERNGPPMGALTRRWLGPRVAAPQRPKAVGALARALGRLHEPTSKRRARPVRFPFA